MSTKKPTKPSTANSLQMPERLQEEIARADAIVIGAGAGLSAAAGLTYSGKRFEDNFSDFIAQYHYKDMYSAGFYPYPTPEEHWAYWSRHINLNRYATDGGLVYENLLKLAEDRDYFVITTNVDHCFQKAGFDKQRLFYTQGDYGLWQCSKPCSQTTYDNEETVRLMVARQKERQVPSGLVPNCPVCERPPIVNLRCDGTFVEGEGWDAAAKRYANFVAATNDSRVLFLELGVGSNTPGIIKYPFWNMVHQNPKAVYACINRDEAVVPQELASHSLCIAEDIKTVLGA